MADVVSLHPAIGPAFVELKACAGKVPNETVMEVVNSHAHLAQQRQDGGWAGFGEAAYASYADAFKKQLQNAALPFHRYTVHDYDLHYVFVDE
jgi:hypothetical protein